MRHGGIALAALLALAGPAGGAAIDGRALFQGYASFAAGGMPPVTACADCHGAAGSGGGEGPLRAPPVTWAALTAARVGEPPYASADEIRRAIERGEGRGRRALSGAMPRLRLSDEEASALVDYLRRVGTPDDRPPGVSTGEIRLGTILPLDGERAAIGRAVLAGLRDVFDVANAAGGVHGRRILLDAAQGNGEAALRDLSGGRAFALVGAILPEGGGAAAWQARNRVSSIAGLAVHAREAGIDRWSLDLLPPLDVQRAALAGALRACPPGARRVALFAGDAPAPGDGVEWFSDPERFRAAMAGSGGAGCVGHALADVETAAEAAPATWRRVSVLPVPAALLAEERRRERPGLWRELGRASARVAVELLAAAGPALHERSLIEGIAGLNGFEAIRAAPLRMRAGARFAYLPETIETEPAARPEIAVHHGGDTP